MQLVQKTFPGIALLVNINFDRLFSIGTIIVGLLAGAFLGTAILGNLSRRLIAAGPKVHRNYHIWQSYPQ